MPARPSIAAASEPASPPPAMTTSVCRIGPSQDMSVLEEKAQGTLKRLAQSRSAPMAIAALRPGSSPQAITVNQGLMPDGAFATNAIYRIDNPLVLIGLHSHSASSRRSGVPCRHRSCSNATPKRCLGPIPKLTFMHRSRPSLGRAARSIELSLHHDLDLIEADWRAFEETADCTVFQTFDWLSTWFRNIGVHEDGKPAVVIGRHKGTILFLLPFALEGRADLRKITWLGSYSVQLQRACAGARFFAAREHAPQFVRGLARSPAAAAEASWATDLVDLEKMPATIGEQAQSYSVALGVTPHVNDAYLTTLAGNDWEAITRRSVRRRRAGPTGKKRKRLADARRIQVHHRRTIVTMWSAASMR